MPATKKLRAEAKIYITELIAGKKNGSHYSDRRLDEVEVAELEKLASEELWQQSNAAPVKMPAFLPVWDGKKYHGRPYLYQDAFWSNNLAHTDAEMKLLVQEAAEAQRKRFTRLQKKFSDSAAE